MLTLFDDQDFQYYDELELLDHFFGTRASATLTVGFRGFRQCFLARLRMVNRFLGTFIDSLESICRAFFATTSNGGYTGIGSANRFADMSTTRFSFYDSLFSAAGDVFHFLTINHYSLRDAIVFSFSNNTDFFNRDASGEATFASGIFSLIQISLSNVSAQYRLESVTAQHISHLFRCTRSVRAHAFDLIRHGLRSLFNSAFGFSVRLRYESAITKAHGFRIRVTRIVFITRGIERCGMIITFFRRARYSAHGNDFSQRAYIRRHREHTTRKDREEKAIKFDSFERGACNMQRFIRVQRSYRRTTLHRAAIAGFAALQEASRTNFTCKMQERIMIRRRNINAFTRRFVGGLHIADDARHYNGRHLHFAANRRHEAIDAQRRTDARVRAAGRVFFAAISAQFTYRCTTAGGIFLSDIRGFARFIFIRNFIFDGRHHSNFEFSSVGLHVALLFINSTMDVARADFDRYDGTHIRHFICQLQLPIPAQFANFFRRFVSILGGGLLLFVARRCYTRRLIFTRRFDFEFGRRCDNFDANGGRVRFTLFRLILDQIRCMLIVSMACTNDAGQAVRQGAERERYYKDAGRHSSVQIGLQIGEGRNNSGLGFISRTFQRRQTGQTIGRAHSRNFTFT